MWRILYCVSDPNPAAIIFQFYYYICVENTGGGDIILQKVE